MPQTPYRTTPPMRESRTARGLADARPHVDTPTLLSTIWISVLFADVLRGVHETLRPGFVSELAFDGTNYGNVITDAALFWYGILLAFIASVVVLSRVLPRRSNRVVNIVAALMMMSGVLASWPKDPDDLVFGAMQVSGSLAVITICVRWNNRR